MNIEHTPRPAVPGDEPILRQLRLLALSDSPAAFGSTYERESARTTSDWRKWMAPGVTFILDTPEGAKGLVAGMHDETDQDVVHLRAMWVSPELRGSGASDGLVKAIISWAESVGARVIRLEIMQGNTSAQRCYERNGFRATGKAQSHEGDARVQTEMERLVNASPR